MKKYKSKINETKFYDVLSIPSNPEDLFTLLYPIGNGGFGKVYKAIHNSSKQVYAIKIIDYTKGNINDKSNISFNYNSIQQETSLMRLVNKSDYIIKYYGSYFSRESNTIWLILEYCSSGSAVDLMLSMGRTLSEVEVATIMEMILKGLIYIHKLNLIHRDIKGANIMLSEDGYAKLGDFGVGIRMTNEEYRTSKKGSPHWMSPQVILNKNYDMKTDIWSLGITCLELVEGEPPFADLNPEEVMEHIAKKPPKAEDVIDPKEHTRDFIDFVNGCLEINPKKRPTAEALIKHPFIKKLSKKKEFLKKLIKEHIEEVEKFRIDKEEYLASKENMEEEDEDIKEIKIINNNSEEASYKKSSYSVGNNVVSNDFINNGGIKTNINEIKDNGKEESNIINGYYNENNENIINEDKNFHSNNSINNKSLNKKAKNISALSNENNLNLSDYSFKKNNLGQKDEIKNEKNKQTDEKIVDKDKEFIIISSDEIIKDNNDNNNENFKRKISEKKLINNNLNSNGGKIEKNLEDIEESSDEGQIKPIDHSIINENYKNNKLENLRNSIKIETNNVNKQKKKISIPPLNLKGILKNKQNVKDIENDELNTHDSPTHVCSFSLFKIHNKYFN